MLLLSREGKEDWRDMGEDGDGGEILKEWVVNRRAAQTVLLYVVIYDNYRACE